MGSVYLAEDPVIGRQVAIKVLRSHTGLEGDELAEILARFQREFRSAGTLTHPSIVTVYDVGQQSDGSFIAMEYVRGESLEPVLQSDRILSFKEISDLAAQLGSALDYAHERNIVHRDIKPANILMTWDGQPKITDFGVAKLSTSTMTRTGTIIGTPAYMAPEQVTGHPVTGASDQFSLGVILYEMLTGERPFSAESPTSILYKIVHEDPRPPREINRDLPLKINEVLLKALAKDPTERYESCTDLAKAVRRALGAAPPPESMMTPAPRESTLRKGASEAILNRRARHKSRGSRATWIAIAAIALVASGIAWKYLGPGRSATTTEVAETQEESVVQEGTKDLEGSVEPPDAGGSDLADSGERGLPTTPSPDEPVSPNGVPEGETLRIVSQPPGATVLVDGAALEEVTPLDLSLLPSEEIELRLELDGYNPTGMVLALDQLSGEVRAKGELFFPMSLSVPPGRLVIRASFPLTVRIGTKVHGPDKEMTIPLNPGEYQVDMTAPEVFLREKARVQLDSDRDLILPLPATVPISVTAVPGNCRISIDGQEVDYTPLRNLPVAAGPHELTFFWPGLNKTTTRREVISPDNRQFSARASE